MEVCAVGRIFWQECNFSCAVELAQHSSADPESEIGDPEKTYPGSGYRGSKSTPDPKTDPDTGYDRNIFGSTTLCVTLPDQLLWSWLWARRTGRARWWPASWRQWAGGTIRIYGSESSGKDWENRYQSFNLDTISEDKIHLLVLPDMTLGLIKWDVQKNISDLTSSLINYQCKTQKANKMTGR